MANVEDLETPAVTIQLDRLEANIARVQAMLVERRIANRPHIKTHKIPEIGRMQMATGAVGITCQHTRNSRQCDHPALRVRRGLDQRGTPRGHPTGSLARRRSSRRTRRSEGYRRLMG
jgi:hypothetical protein